MATRTSPLCTGFWQNAGGQSCRVRLDPKRRQNGMKHDIAIELFSLTLNYINFWMLGYLLKGSGIIIIKRDK
jgi:hypothetical protein